MEVGTLHSGRERHKRHHVPCFGRPVPHSAGTKCPRGPLRWHASWNASALGQWQGGTNNMLWEEHGHWTTPQQHSVFMYVYVCVYVCVHDFSGGRPTLPVRVRVLAPTGALCPRTPTDARSEPPRRPPYVLLEDALPCCPGVGGSGLSCRLPRGRGEGGGGTPARLGRGGGTSCCPCGGGDGTPACCSRGMGGGLPCRLSRGWGGGGTPVRRPWGGGG